MKSLIKKILKEETENDDRDYSFELTRIAKILKIVPISKYTCLWLISKKLAGNTILVLKLIPEYMINESKDNQENLKISKIINSNIVSNYDLLVHSIPYNYQEKSCEERIEMTSKIEDFILIRPNNRK